MALTNLYPPIVDTYMPAFTIDDADQGICRIYFALSPFNSAKITKVWLSLVDQNTNLSLLSTDTGLLDYYYPFDGDSGNKGSTTLEVKRDSTRPGNDKFYIEVSSKNLKSKTWNADRAYKVQLRFSSGALNNNSTEIVEKQSALMSEWSKICLIYPINIPKIFLTGFYLTEGEVASDIVITSYNNIINGYMQTKGKETLESYRIKIYSAESHKLEYDSDIIYSDAFSPNSIYHEIKYGLIDGVRYKLNFEYTTKNLYQGIESIEFIVINKAGERINATITATPNDEMGRIEVNITSDTENYFGNLIIRRASHKDNFMIWEDVKKVVIYEANNLNILWYDYTAESGVWYKYCVQKCTPQGIRGLVVATENPAMINLEDIFITGEGGRTLRVKFNPQINSFTHTLSESSQQTLGGKYPFIKRNGNVGYKQFSISGLISHLMDEGDLFTSQEELYNNQNTLYFDYNENKNITEYNNIIIEKEFRDKVYNFLHDGKVKLFRSSTEGSFLIRLMNVSLTPENALGRMLYSFNGTAYEIDNCSIENLNKYNLYDIGELADISVGVYEDSQQVVLTGNGKLKKSVIDVIQNQEQVKNTDSNYESNVMYFDRLEIQMECPPMVYVKEANSEDYTCYNKDSTPLRDIDPKADIFYGYVFKITFDDKTTQQFLIGPNGYLLLEADGLKIKDAELIYTDDYLYITNCHFIAEKKEKENLSSKSFKITSKVSQVYGNFSPTKEIGDFIYQKHYINNSKEYARLYSLNAIEIETAPNTVLYLSDSSSNKAKRFVIGDTGFLRIEDEDFIIKDFSLLGKTLINKTDTENYFLRDNEYVVAGSAIANSVSEIENPEHNHIYRVASLEGIWIPDNINSSSIDNDYLQQLEKWAEPKSLGGESYYNIIYHHNQWFLFILSNKDIIKPTNAIITYYFDLEGGSY